MPDYNGLKISGRIIASTAFKYGRGWDLSENPWTWSWVKTGLMNIDDFGAFVTKTITLPKRDGFYTNHLKPWKVLRIYPHKILNRFGWNNCGFREFIDIHLPRLEKDISKCIVSLGALDSIEEIFTMLEEINDHDVAGTELNISCHNVNLDFLSDLTMLRNLFRGARTISRHPLIVKINAESDYRAIARIAQSEGINLIHAINTLRVYSKALGGHCGQSSYKNKEVALRIISKLRTIGITIPIIGGSGIWTIKDVKDFENAGADLFSMSHQFLYLPFWPGIVSQRERRDNDRTKIMEESGR